MKYCVPLLNDTFSDLCPFVGQYLAGMTFIDFILKSSEQVFLCLSCRPEVGAVSSDYPSTFITVHFLVCVPGVTVTLLSRASAHFSFLHTLWVLNVVRSALFNPPSSLQLQPVFSTCINSADDVEDDCPCKNECMKTLIYNPYLHDEPHFIRRPCQIHYDALTGCCSDKVLSFQYSTFLTLM